MFSYFSNHDGVFALNIEQEQFGGNIGDTVVCDGVGIVGEGGFGMIFDVIAVDVEAELQGSL